MMTRKLKIIMVTALHGLLVVSYTLGQSGTNLWRLIYNAGTSVQVNENLLSSQIEQCCTILSAVDRFIFSDVDLMSTRINSLSSQTSTIKSELDSVSTKVDSVGSQISTVKSDLDACCNTLSILDVIIKSDVDSVSSKIDAASSSSSISDTILKSDIDSVSTKIDSVGSQITLTNSSLAVCCAMLSTLDRLILSDVDSVSSKIDAASSSSSISDTILKSDIDSVSTKIDSVGSQITLTNSSLAVCCAMLSTLDRLILSDVDSVSSKIDAASSSSSISDTILKSDIDSVSTKIDSVGSQITSTKSSLDACCTTLSTLDRLILSDVDSVSSKVDAFNSCLLGTQITQAMVPYTISQPGHYYLCSSVSASGSPTITVNASNVSLDLAGFTVTNTNNKGIATSGASLSNITIENGYINTASNLALDVSNVTNLTIRNNVINTSSSNAFSASTITNLIMQNCKVSAGAFATAVQLTAIAGGRLTDVLVRTTAAILGFGFAMSNIVANTTLELINCVCDTLTVDGFSQASTTGTIILRSCIANKSAEGFLISGPTLLENCIASGCSQEGFRIQAASDVVMRNCTAVLTAPGPGFRIIASVRTVCEGCISQSNNLSGFEVQQNGATPTINCTLDRCVAKNNSDGFFIVANSTNTHIIDCIASNNSGSGINNASASTIIVDCRSQAAANALTPNPAYNLNGVNDILGGATVVIIS